jgi:hypothetical protein
MATVLSRIDFSCEWKLRLSYGMACANILLFKTNTCFMVETEGGLCRNIVRLHTITVFVYGNRPLLMKIIMNSGGLRKNTGIVVVCVYAN